MADLLELAERCEAASGPDRKLDSEIYLLRYPYQSHLRSRVAAAARANPPAYTASLDAAMTLVPDTMRWCVDTCDGTPRSFVEPPHPYEGQPYWGNAATPALALCAAALRARMTLPTSKQERTG